MSDFVISLIRTWVPTAVAGFVAYLTTLGVEYSAEAEQQLAAAVVLLVGAVYYGLVRVLENRWPVFGYLLGVAKTPVYTAGE